jgi:hypothetical protein
MGATLDLPWAGQAFAPPTPLDVASIESAIAAQLKSQISVIEIAQFPDRPSAYRLTHRIGAALIAWRAASYGPLIDTASVVQTRRLEFEINLLMRDLGWAFGAGPSGPNPGAYSLLESIRAALTGFRIPGCRKLFPVKEQFLGRDPQGWLWTWSAIYALDTMALEASTQDNFPLFVRGVALEDGGQTSYISAAAAYTFNAQDTIQLPAANVANLVLTPESGGAPYISGTDYVLDAVNGIIARIGGGSISAGAIVRAAYTYSDSVFAVSGGTPLPISPHN